MNILVADDNEDLIKSFVKVLKDYTIIPAKTKSETLKKLETADEIKIAIIDIKLGSDDGLEVLEFIRRNYPLIECIMISGYSTVEKAVKAIKMGAFDFLEKPISYEKLKITVKNALEHRNFSKYLEELKKNYMLIGESKVIKELNEVIDKAALTDFPVLITGESGTGKERVANLIHLKSRYSFNEMVVVNCASIPDSLLESELFGHEKGAFTGAVRERVGKIEKANNNTLFLDEIGDMPLVQQAKLLRVLENGEYTRIGGETKRKSRFRLISATNKDLQLCAEEGKFREDLYFRISAIRIHVKPLRERKEDIPALINHFLSELNRETGMGPKQIGKDALAEIMKLQLKGNVRELKNLVSRLYVLSKKNIIDRKDLLATESGYLKNKYQDEDEIFSKTMRYSDAKRELERYYLKKQLEKHGYNISKTAISLGMLPNNLVRKLKSLSVRNF